MARTKNSVMAARKAAAAAAEIEQGEKRGRSTAAVSRGNDENSAEANNDAMPSPSKQPRRMKTRQRAKTSPLTPPTAIVVAAVNRPSKNAADAAVAAERQGLAIAAAAESQNDGRKSVSHFYNIATNAQIGDNQFTNALVQTANIQTKEYMKKQSRYIAEFMQSALNNIDLAELMEITEDPGHANQPVPTFVLVCRGVPPTRVEQNRIMNTLLVNYFVSTKNKNTGEELAPGTWETQFKALLACLKQTYGLPYSLSHFKGFTGSLDAVAATYWKECVKKNPSFGKSKKKVMTEAEHDQVVRFLRSNQFKALADSDPIYLLFALNWTVGTFFALRGRKEHHALRKDSFRFGFYSDNHPLAGHQYCEFKDQNLFTKVNSIRLGNTGAAQKSENGDALRYPMQKEMDYSNVGNVLHLLLKQLPSTYDRLYVFPLDPTVIRNQKLCESNTRYSVSNIGINTLGKFIKRLCQAAGLVDWEAMTPHMMRAFCCTTLANDPSVNENEVARTLRHKSVDSQRAYIGMTTTSELARASAVMGHDSINAMIANAGAKDSEDTNAAGTAAPAAAAPVAAAPVAAAPVAAPIPPMPPPYYNPYAHYPPPPPPPPYYNPYAHYPPPPAPFNPYAYGNNQQIANPGANPGAPPIAPPNGGTQPPAGGSQPPAGGFAYPPYPPYYGWGGH